MPHSNYTKIYDLLIQLSKQEAPRELFEFAEEVHDANLESFAIWRPGAHPGLPPAKSYCSAESIRRLLRFVAELGLIEIGEGHQCSLTSTGINALRGEQYRSSLATHIAMYLKNRAGVTYSEIKDTIASIRRPEVPFYDTIYRRISSEYELNIGKNRLRMVLYLLERCEALSSVTKKIYFVPKV